MGSGGGQATSFKSLRGKWGGVGCTDRAGQCNEPHFITGTGPDIRYFRLCVTSRSPLGLGRGGTPEPSLLFLWFPRVQDTGLL